jgi:hypothetical protein
MKRLCALSAAIVTGAFMLICSPFLMGQAPAFTETFESGKIDPAVWDQRVTGTSTVAVEAVDGAHGKFALHVHYPAISRNSYAFLVSPHVPASLSGHIFGRVYMKVVGDIGPTHNALMFAGGLTWPASKFYEIGTRGIPNPMVPSWMPSFQENKSPAGQGRGEITYHSDGPVPIGKWFLLEWEMNDNPAAITIWVDGEKVVTTFNNEKIDTVKFEWPKGSGTVSGLIGGFQEVGFGARVWGSNAAEFDVYYDDIAIGATRIGPAK